MDRTSIGLMILLGALVYGAFQFSRVDQVELAAAELRTDIALDRAPAIEATAVDLGMQLTRQVMASVIVSLVFFVGVFLYQQARIRELKEGGWERFWQRRQPPQAKPRMPRAPSLKDVLLAMWMDRRRK